MFPSRRVVLGGDVFRDDYSLGFDGTNDYIQTGDPFNYTNITVSAWVKVTGDSLDDSIWQNRDSLNDGMVLYFDTSEYLICKVNGTATGADSVNAVTAGTWNHVVGTWDGTTIKTYINGVAKNYISCSGTMDVSTNARIGKNSYNTFLSYYGNISEVAVYNSTLTASQVKTLYNGREPYNHKEGIATGNLKAWWRMGDGALDHRQTDGVIGDEVNPTTGAELINPGSQSGTITDGSTPWFSDNDGSGGDAQQASISSSTITFDTSVASDWETLSYTGTPSTTGIYKLKCTVARTSGSFNIYSDRGTDYVHRTVSSSGTYTTYLKHEDSAWLVRFGSSSFVGTISDISLKLMNGNSGIMVNFDGSDFTGDTP